jgi:hypothetical protein
MLASQQPANPAVDEVIKPDGLAARRIERLACRPAGRPGDDGTKIGLPDQLVHVDTPHHVVDIDSIEQSTHIDPPHDVIDVRPRQQRVDVHPAEKLIYLDPVQQRVHIHPGQDFADVDLIEYRIQVDQANQGIDIHCPHDKVHHMLGDVLGKRIRRVGHAFACRAQPVQRVHGTQYGRAGTAGIIRQG